MLLVFRQILKIVSDYSRSPFRICVNIYYFVITKKKRKAF